MMHVRAFSFLGLRARNSLTFAALRSGDGLGPRCQYYRSPSMYPQRSVMTCGLATALEPPHFNHAPVRGAIGAIQYVAGYVTKFQSTHPRGVRRDGQPPDCRCGDVSIHAPAWGATRTRRVSAPKPEPVSIHAPAWGATRHLLVRLRGMQVSIHAPAWGATGCHTCS